MVGLPTISPPTSCCENDRSHVHQLVAEAFHGPRPEGLLVLHADDDPSIRTQRISGGGMPNENAAEANRASVNPNHCFSDELSLLAGFFGLPDPIVRGELGEDLHGCFLKDYSPSNW